MDGAALIPEFDQEMANTRSMLERVPDDRFDFKPHEKSWSLHELAAHVANVPTWTGATLTTEELDLAEPWTRELPGSAPELLAGFDAVVSEARAALEGATAEDMAVAPSRGRHPHVRDEPYHPPPGAARRLPAAPRRAGPGDVRPVRRRAHVGSPDAPNDPRPAGPR